MSAVHITPLTRNQLLDLEALFSGLIHAVNTSQPSSAAHSPVSTPIAPGGSVISTRPSAFATAATAPSDSHDENHARSNDDDARGEQGHSSQNLYSEAAADTHPVLRGAFVDVFADAHTKQHWRQYDKMLYLVWWSHRPPCCLVCGMQEAWVPSSDSEMKCAQCGAGAGSTRMNDIVEDRYNAHSPEGGDGDDDDDMDSVSGGDADDVFGNGGGRGGAAEEAAGGTTVSSSSAAIPFYLFCYDWLQRIVQSQSLARVVGTAKAAANASAFAGQSQSGSGATQVAGVPTGEALPAVLRAAYDMSSLLCLPGMNAGATHVVRAACLYLSLVLHRFATPFPLFCLAATTQNQPQQPAPSTAKSGTRQGLVEEEECGAGAAALASPASYYSSSDLQWVDVELLAALTGVGLADFFENKQVAAQYLQNVLTLASLATCTPVPSIVWHPLRVPGRLQRLVSLAECRREVTPVHATQRTSALSPDHTAMVVALEFARQLDEQPLALQLVHESTTKPSGTTEPPAPTAKVMMEAKQQAEKISRWLDGLGLYPHRTVYRAASYYGGGDPSPPGENGSDTHREAEQRLEAALLSRSAVADLAGALAAAEEQAARDEGGNDAGPDEPPAQRPRCRPTVMGTAATASVLTTPDSPFAGWMENILPSPCANALLHVFAATFRLSPLELADAAVRSGLYRGPSNFLTLLEVAVRRGAFFVMPLARRVSPVSSIWSSAYMCLHSSDRLAFLAALHQLNQTQNTSRERAAALGRILQKLLRKHQSSNTYQVNFTLHVVDEAEKHFNGVYFLSSVLADGAVATFTCLRSGRKTISFNAHNRTISLCFFREKERVVKTLRAYPRGPLLAQLESESAKAVVSTVVGSGSGGNSNGGAEQWSSVVRNLDRCGRVRRRMRVPMLASRLDALASIREAQSMTLHPVAGAATLLGWGETESVLESPPPVDVLRLRWELQQNMLGLPSAAALYGLSENRIVAMYASLVALLEFIESHARQQAAAMEREAQVRRNRKQRYLEHLGHQQQQGSTKRTPSPVRVKEEADIKVEAEVQRRVGDAAAAPLAEVKRESTEDNNTNDTEEEEDDLLSPPQAALNTWIEELLDSVAPEAGAAVSVGDYGGGPSSRNTSPYLAPTSGIRAQLTPMMRPITATPVLGARNASAGVTITRKPSDHNRTAKPSSLSPQQQQRQGQQSPTAQQRARLAQVTPPLPRPTLTPERVVLPQTSSARPRERCAEQGRSPPTQRVDAQVARRNRKRGRGGSRSPPGTSPQHPQTQRLRKLGKPRTQSRRGRFPTDGSSSSSSSSSSDSDSDDDCASSDVEGRGQRLSGGRSGGSTAEQRFRRTQATTEESDDDDDDGEPPPLQLAASTTANDQAPAAANTDSDSDDVATSYSSSDGHGRKAGRGFADLQEAQRRDAQQVRARQAALAQEQAQRQMLVRQHLRLSLPTYWEVLLGMCSAAPPASQGADLDETSQSRSSRALSACKPSRPLPHASLLSSAPQRAEAAKVAQSPFNLFSAEECRRRLHRLFVFVKQYEARRAELWSLALQGMLPPVVAPSMGAAAVAKTAAAARETAPSTSPALTRKRLGGQVGRDSGHRAVGSQSRSPSSSSSSGSNDASSQGDKGGGTAADDAGVRYKGRRVSPSKPAHPLPTHHQQKGHHSTPPIPPRPHGRKNRSRSAQNSPRGIISNNNNNNNSNNRSPQQRPGSLHDEGVSSRSAGTFPKVKLDDDEDDDDDDRKPRSSSASSSAWDGSTPGESVEPTVRSEAMRKELTTGSDAIGTPGSGSATSSSAGTSPALSASSAADSSSTTTIATTSSTSSSSSSSSSSSPSNSEEDEDETEHAVEVADTVAEVPSRRRMSGRRRRRLEKRWESRSARFHNDDAAASHEDKV